MDKIMYKEKLVKFILIEKTNALIKIIMFIVNFKCNYNYRKIKKVLYRF